MADLKEVLRMLRPARTCPRVNRLLLMDPVSLSAASPSFPVACTTHSKSYQRHKLQLMNPVSPNAALSSFQWPAQHTPSAVSVIDSYSWILSLPMQPLHRLEWNAHKDGAAAGPHPWICQALSIACLEVMLLCVHLMVDSITA